MKTLVFGAGPIGCLYTHRLAEAGMNVAILARGQRYHQIQRDGLALIDEISANRETSKPQVVDALRPEDDYDLVIVLVRKNKLPALFPVLAVAGKVKNILFMGNNALGFGSYLETLPEEKLLFGFPGAGGGLREGVVHYADREKPGGRCRAVTIGERDGKTTDGTKAIKSLFEASGIPVDITNNIDGWLKYHVALVSPLVNALYKHDCNNYALARDDATLRVMVLAAREGGSVLKALGYTRRHPFEFNLFYWLPEILNVRALRALLESKFAEIAFSMHAMSARDEMGELANEFQMLIDRTSIATPSIDQLRGYAQETSQGSQDRGPSRTAAGG